MLAWAKGAGQAHRKGDIYLRSRRPVSLHMVTSQAWFTHVGYGWSGRFDKRTWCGHREREGDPYYYYYYSPVRSCPAGSSDAPRRCRGAGGPDARSSNRTRTRVSREVHTRGTTERCHIDRRIAWSLAWSGMRCIASVVSACVGHRSVVSWTTGCRVVVVVAVAVAVAVVVVVVVVIAQ